MTHASGAKALMSSLIVPAAQMHFFVSKGTSNINTQSSQCMWTKYVHGSNTSYNMHSHIQSTISLFSFIIILLASIAFSASATVFRVANPNPGDGIITYMDCFTALEGHLHSVNGASKGQAAQKTLLLGCESNYNSIFLHHRLLAFPTKWRDHIKCLCSCSCSCR